MKLTVRNMQTQITAGWIVRASKLGLRVVSRAGRFGDEIYLVTMGDDFIQVTQNANVGRKLDVSLFTPGKMAIVSKLKECRLIV